MICQPGDQHPDIARRVTTNLIDDFLPIDLQDGALTGLIDLPQGTAPGSIDKSMVTERIGQCGKRTSTWMPYKPKEWVQGGGLAEQAGERLLLRSHPATCRRNW